MGGFFGVASKKDCILEAFYGVDYHSIGNEERRYGRVWGWRVLPGDPQYENSPLPVQNSSGM